jgi:hypothetical protein
MGAAKMERAEKLLFFNAMSIFWNFIEEGC